MKMGAVRGLKWKKKKKPTAEIIFLEEQQTAVMSRLVWLAVVLRASFRSVGMIQCIIYCINDTVNLDDSQNPRTVSEGSQDPEKLLGLLLCLPPNSVNCGVSHRVTRHSPNLELYYTLLFSADCLPLSQVHIA